MTAAVPPPAKAPHNWTPLRILLRLVIAAQLAAGVAGLVYTTTTDDDDAAEEERLPADVRMERTFVGVCSTGTGLVGTSEHTPGTPRRAFFAPVTEAGRRSQPLLVLRDYDSVACVDATPVAVQPCSFTTSDGQTISYESWGTAVNLVLRDSSSGREVGRFTALAGAEPCRTGLLPNVRLSDQSKPRYQVDWAAIDAWIATQVN